MKYLSSIFMFVALGALLYINIGNMARISLGVAQAQQEAKEELANTANQQTITITQQQIDRGQAAFINNHEVKLNGKMYDIASLSHTGGTYTLQVFHDEKEEGLLSDLKEQVEQWFNTTNDNTTNNKPTLKHQDILKDFIPSHKLAVTISSQNNSYATLAVLLPQSPAQLVITGPPKMA